MSKPKVFEKPGGVKDYLPEAVNKLRTIEWNVLACMKSWGYRQIMTPTLEYYDTVGVASSTANEKLFKLLDKRGTTLVLRSEMTAPIARVVASLLKEEALPLRLSHHSNVFRAIEEEAGREAEFFQTGIELVGDGSAEADAEVVALAIACLKAAGVTKFKIALGHIGFLNGVFDSTLDNFPEEQHILKECLLKRDYVGYRHSLKSVPVSDEAKLELERILRLRGGKEVCQDAEQLTKDPAALASLRHLCEVWDVLADYGVSDHVLIDLTMIGNFSYYTGLIFEGYAADLGFPVCSGGRYDSLLESFGRPATATGFALATNRIMEVALADPKDNPYRVLILYNRKMRAEAVRTALELRNRQGYMVETRYTEHLSSAAMVNIAEDGKYHYEDGAYQEIIYFVE
ncbi:MAG: ATP phosphoribosyltransferase regulatory subunit [Paenibacillaceae bacterium]